MIDQARMSFQPEVQQIGRAGEQPMREAACEAYLPENQSIFRAERGNSSSSEHLPSIRIIFEQGPPVGFARPQVGGAGPVESPQDRYERGFERDHADYDRFNHKRFDHSKHTGRDQLMPNSGNCSGENGTNLSSNIESDPKLDRSARPSVNESPSLFSGNSNIAALLERLADLFRHGASSRHIDSSRYIDSSSGGAYDRSGGTFIVTPKLLTPDSVRPLSKFPTLPDLPGFGDVPNLPNLPELPVPPLPKSLNPFDLPKLPVPELPAPDKLLNSIPGPHKFLNKLFG